MNRKRLNWALLACALCVAVVVGGCGKSSSGGDGSGESGEVDVKAANLPVSTPAGSKEVDKVTWAVYREITTLDPILAGDYPEMTGVSLMCESLLRQEPDGTIVPGLAEKMEYVNPTTVQLDLRKGVTFWDGNPLTPEDVVFSLERQTDESLGGLWGGELTSIKSIEATGPMQVTLHLKHPDYWLEGALSYIPGVIVEKKYVEEKGKDYGTPAGGIMCTGSYKLDSWATGGAVKAVRNDSYWNSSVKPLVKEIDLKGVSEESTLTAGLETGEINGSYPLALSTLEELEGSGKVTVHQGRSYSIDAMIVANFNGVLGDARVRRALSMALDRESLAQALYKGAASPAKALATPGQWGYAREKFAAAWEALPGDEVEVEAAKKLIEEAGATGKTLTLATSTELKSIDLQVTALSNAAKSIGLKVKVVNNSSANYFNYFVDPKARETVDAFFTVNLSDWAEPAYMYQAIALPKGAANYNGYDNPKVISLLEQVRETKDRNRRADLVIEAQKLIVHDMPWIPTVAPTTLLTLSSDLTGAIGSSTYLFAPWANELGGKE